MSPITKIAKRQLKNHKKRNFIMMIAVSFSMAIISFFMFFKRQTELYPSPYDGAFWDNYLSKFIFCINATVIFLFFATFFTLNTYCKLKNEEIKMESALLSALGATKFQKSSIILIQLTTLYPLPIIIGTLAGIFPGIMAGRYFLSAPLLSFDIKESMLNLIMAALLIIMGIAVTIISYLFSSLELEKKSVINKVNSQNIAASETRHGYRESNTFKRKPFIQRLGKKSAEYYCQTYNAISRTFTIALSYPALTILIMIFVGFAETAWDETVKNAFVGILTTLIVCMVVLSAIGFILVILLSKYQIEIKKQTMKTYLAIGMTHNEINNMILYELKSVILRSVVQLIFIVAVMFIIFDGYCKVFNIFNYF